MFWICLLLNFVQIEIVFGAVFWGQTNVLSVEFSRGVVVSCLAYEGVLQETHESSIVCTDRNLFGFNPLIFLCREAFWEPFPYDR